MDAYKIALYSILYFTFDAVTQYIITITFGEHHYLFIYVCECCHIGCLRWAARKSNFCQSLFEGPCREPRHSASSIYEDDPTSSTQQDDPLYSYTYAHIFMYA